MACALSGSEEIAAVTASILLASPAAAQAQPAPSPIVLACVPPSQRNLPMSRVSAAQRRAIVVCVLRGMARELNAQTPVRMGEDSLESVIAADATIYYNYRLNVTAETFPAAERSQLGERTRANVCAAPDMRRTISMGGGFGYQWFNRSGRLLHQILVDRC